MNFQENKGQTLASVETGVGGTASGVPQDFPQGRAQRVTSGPQGDGELELTGEQWELVLRSGQAAPVWAECRQW